jgi:ABC-type multidrug transport system permease subunit
MLNVLSSVSYPQMTFDVGTNLTLLGTLFLALKYLLPLVVFAGIIYFVVIYLPHIIAYFSDNYYNNFNNPISLLIVIAILLLILAWII